MVSIIVAAVLATLTPTTQHAHAPSLLEWDAGADTVVAGGQLVGGLEGWYTVVSPRAAVTLLGRATVQVAVPVAWLKLQGGSDVWGMGDVTASAGVRFEPTADLRLTASVWSMWPTGDQHRGLGSGHLMLAPRVDASWSYGKLALGGWAMLRGGLPLGAHAGHHHQSVIAPHDLLDVAALGRVGITVADQVRLWAVGAPVFTLIQYPGTAVGTRFSAGPEASVQVGGVRAIVRALFPVTQTRTESWSITVALAYGDDPAVAAATVQSCH